MKNPSLHLAGCVVRNEKGGILLLHRNKKGVQQWELPGGKLEPGEKPEQAAVRELEEELGVTVSIQARLGEASFTEKEQECLYTWFAAEIVGEEQPVICEPQTFDDLRYWSLSTLRERADVSANLKNLLKSEVL
jgi:8-oxo-dGTP diphosphatase